MTYIENIAKKIRHSKLLKNASWLWKLIRPIYEMFIRNKYRHGLDRKINGEDKLKIVPSLRNVISEKHEPEVWQSITSEVKEGDVIIDIGAHVGVYTISLAKRVRLDGKVIAFEPDPENFKYLEKQIRLNGVRSRVRLMQMAVSSESGIVEFLSGISEESRVYNGKEKGQKVQTLSLDDIDKVDNVDIVKIDVEGHEKKVLLGGKGVLSGTNRPKLLYREMHTGGWENEKGSELVEILSDYGYSVKDLNGGRVRKIDSYGVIVAYRKHGR